MDSQDKKSARRMTRRTKRNLVLLCAVAAAVIAAACYTVFIKPAQDVEQWEYREQAVQRGTLSTSVTESGSVEFGITAQIYDLDVSTDEDSDDEEDEDGANYLKVAEVYVAVGQRVREGDKIYRFTSESIEAVRRALTYERTEAHLALATAQTEYETGVLEAGLSRDETLLGTALAQTSYDTAIARLSNDMAAKSLEIKQLLDDIYKLQCDLTDEDYLEEKSDIIEAYEKAMEDVEDAADNYVTNKIDVRQAFETARSSYEQFFDQLDESEQQIQDKIDETHKIEAEAAYSCLLLEKELLSARQELDMSAVSGGIADVKYQSSLKSYENTLAKARRDLEEAQKKLDAFEEFVGDGTVCAEGSGIVTQTGYAVGDYLTNTGTLIAFAKAQDMTVSVDVSQEDIVSIKVGDPVELRLSAYEGETYKGTVKSMTTTATSRNSAAISYTVDVSIQGDTSKLYGGMTADVTFVTEKAENVIYVLRKALVEENGKSQLYIKSGEGYALTPVTTGFNNGEYIEIKDGIGAGDKYYIKTLVNEGGADGK